ncbi:MAG: hypothetical protein ACI9XZ_003148 [Alphaproteobacteria bacterium]|jgi:hypothetical protein
MGILHWNDMIYFYCFRFLMDSVSLEGVATVKDSAKEMFLLTMSCNTIQTVMTRSLALLRYSTTHPYQDFSTRVFDLSRGRSLENVQRGARFALAPGYRLA